jgi:hypothetical protein
MQNRQLTNSKNVENPNHKVFQQPAKPSSKIFSGNLQNGRASLIITSLFGAAERLCDAQFFGTA